MKMRGVTYLYQGIFTAVFSAYIPLWSAGGADPANGRC